MEVRSLFYKVAHMASVERGVEDQVSELSRAIVKG